MPELAVSFPATSTTAAPTLKGHQGQANGRPTAPPRGKNGRPFFIDTPLGKLISDRGLKVYEVVAGAKVNPRTLSDYLSRRKPITAPHKLALADFLGVGVTDLDDKGTP